LNILSWLEVVVAEIVLALAAALAGLFLEL
jgi:hypothetical protein